MVWLLVIVLCGLGTFMMRWFPFWHVRRAGQGAKYAGWLRIWCEGVGPAAIAALLVMSIGNLAADRESLWAWGRILVSLSCTAWVYVRWHGGVAWSSLAGAMLYGLLGIG